MYSTVALTHYTFHLRRGQTTMNAIGIAMDQHVVRCVAVRTGRSDNA